MVISTVEQIKLILPLPEWNAGPLLSIEGHTPPVMLQEEWTGNMGALTYASDTWGHLWVILIM